MNLQFERTPGAICAVLTAPGECDRIITVDRARDAFRAFALDAAVSARWRSTKPPRRR